MLGSSLQGEERAWNRKLLVETAVLKPQKVKGIARDVSLIWGSQMSAWPRLRKGS